MKKIHLPALCQPKELALQSIWGSTMFSLRLASRQVIIQQSSESHCCTDSAW